MSSCRQILVSLLNAPTATITIFKRLSALPVARPLQQAASSNSSQQSALLLPSSVNSSASQNVPQTQRSVLRWGVSCDPTAKEYAGFRKFTEEEIENTYKAELEARQYGQGLTFKR
jgi:hypothetical protein